VSGDLARYDLAAGEVRVTGENVVLRDEQGNRVTGKTVIYDIEKGIARVEAPPLAPVAPPVAPAPAPAPPAGAPSAAPPAAAPSPSGGGTTAPPAAPPGAALARPATGAHA
jgi:hypothetical protein